MKHLTLITALLFSFTACNKDDPNSQDNELYHYIGYDNQGVKIVEGYFSIEFTDSIQIAGEWDYAAIGEPENIGPQIGEGQLIGTIENNEFYAGLNPDMVDNNVNLVGVINGFKIIGDWYYTGYIGLLNAGTFTAEK